MNLLSWRRTSSGLTSDMRKSWRSAPHRLPDWKYCFGAWSSIEEFNRMIAKPTWCDEVFWAYRKPGQTDRPEAVSTMVLSLDMIYIGGINIFYRPMVLFA